MEQSVLFKEAGRNRQLTERDRELCGFLALCRYLTREQVERLMFPGRSKARSSTRLRQLTARVGVQSAVLRGDLGFGSADGWTTVWALTPEGFQIGAERVGLQVDRVPKHDVGQAFLKHEVMVNEVFLGLVPQDGKTPAKVPRQFRWTLGEYLNLPFDEFDQTALRVEKRRLQPDAMIEDPAHQRRYFIEYETGSATIYDAKKATSTKAKVGRYEAFFTGNYRTHFRDVWKPRLLLVTQSAARRESIERLLEKKGFPTTGEYAARALTLEEAQRALCRAIYGAEQPPGVTKHPASVAEPAPAPVTPVTDAPARTASEERLRRGRVSVRGEQLVALEKLLRSSVDALNNTLDVLKTLRLPTEPIPAILRAAPEPMRVLSEYARRGREALSRYRLTAAE